MNLRKYGFAVAALLLLTAVVVPAQKRTMTVEDLFAYERIGVPSLSPDGSRIAFTLGKPNLEENRTSTNIWIIPAEGGEAWQLTNAENGSYGQVWRPNSTEIAFLRGGQPWLISIEGGEARQIAEIPTGASGLKWSPDGSKLLFTSFVCKTCGMDCECAVERPATMKHVTAKVADDLLYRHWDTWRTDAKRSHLFILDVATGEYQNLTPEGDYDVPPFPFGGDGDYAFSPDGTEVAFTAKMDPDPALHTNLNIYTVPADGGEIQPVSDSLKGEETHPVYSPDGKYISFAVRVRPRFEADQPEIYLYNRGDRTMKSLTDDYDRAIAEWLWAPDGESLYFIAIHHGNRPVFRMDLATGEVTEIAGDGFCNGLQASPDGETLYFSYRSLSQPPTIHSVKVDGSDRVDLTPFNDEFFAEIELGEVENHWFTGALGDQVQVWLVKPPNFDESKKWPLLHIIHGGPQQDYANLWTTGWNSQTLAAQGYVVALVCFHATPGYGQEFVDAVTGNWGGTPYEDIMKGTDFLLSLGYIDETRMAAGGGSYGGYMTNWIATQTDRFKALVSHAGLFNLYSMYGATEELWFPEWELAGPYWENEELYERWSPHEYAENLSTPMLVTHGQQDFRVPVSQSMELFTALRRQDVPAELIYYPDENHWILSMQNNYFWYTEFINFLGEHVGEPGGQ
jgi:dipeptidyl aminopeptidase/acylaminoacyl peptidase